MENQDKIVEQFKNAAEKAETKDFPGMEKVWSRVDAKLDTKVFKKQNKNWNKLAIAASVIIVIFISFPFLKANKKIEQPKNELVVTDTTKIVSPKSILDQNPIVAIETTKPIIEQNIDNIAYEANAEVTITDSISTINTTDAIVMNASPIEKSITKEDDQTKSSGRFLKAQIYDAIAVHHKKEEAFEVSKKESEVVSQTKSNPLIVINGKALTSNSDSKSISEELSELEGELESLIELKEPLYIINGTMYSEEELFGVNPTSPYAPLDKQAIETIEILQDKEAIKKYGEKGKKGVVIIATQNGKPAVIQSKK